MKNIFKLGLLLTTFTNSLQIFSADTEHRPTWVMSTDFDGTNVTIFDGTHNYQKFSAIFTPSEEEQTKNLVRWNTLVRKKNRQGHLTADEKNEMRQLREKYYAAKEKVPREAHDISKEPYPYVTVHPYTYSD